MDNKKATSQLSDTTDPNVLYEDLIQQTQDNYGKLITGVEDYAKGQAQAQEATKNQVVAELEDAKERTKTDYTKEQSAAHADYQKQFNPYGVEAEQLAAGGLTGSGYSESAKVSMYNTYQSRVATAKESCDQAVREYNIAIKDAKRLNSATLAEIAYNSLLTRMELTLKALNQDMQLKLDWQAWRSGS